MTATPDTESARILITEIRAAVNAFANAVDEAGLTGDVDEFAMSWTDFVVGDLDPLYKRAQRLRLEAFGDRILNASNGQATVVITRALAATEAAHQKLIASGIETQSLRRHRHLSSVEGRAV